MLEIVEGAVIGCIAKFKIFRAECLLVIILHGEPLLLIASFT